MALLTLFLDLVDLPYQTPNGDGWELRTYATTDGLVPLVEPERENTPEVRHFPVIRRPRVELPSHDDTPTELIDARDELTEDEDREGGLLELDGLKVGGWPSTVQSEVGWTLPGGRVADAGLVLQVDSSEKAGLSIGDAGATAVTRGMNRMMDTGARRGSSRGPERRFAAPHPRARRGR